MLKGVIKKDFSADTKGLVYDWTGRSHISMRFVMLIEGVCLHLQQAYDQKNIRRRVYDALNVLMAMNIISKEKKEIRWIGLPTNSAQECRNLEVGVRERQIHNHKWPSHLF